MSTILIEKLHTALQKHALLPRGGRIVVAVSGGADSAALLHALATVNRKHDMAWMLRAAHLNHGLRGRESDDDELFVRRLALRLRLPLTVARLGTARTVATAKSSRSRRGRDGGGRRRADNKAHPPRDEASLRSARYSFLRDVARRHAAGYVVTAHTLDDQAETVLLRIIRGTGVRGLGAMREERPLAADGDRSRVDVQAKGDTAHSRGKRPERPAARGEIRLVRPLLTVARGEVLEYLKHERLSYREDSSNRDPRYARNFVRHRLMPVLRKLNPNITRALADLSASARKTESFIDFAATEAGPLVGARREETRSLLKVCDLRALPEPVRWAIIRRELERLGLRRMPRRDEDRRSEEMPEFTSVHASGLEALLADSAGTKTIELPGGIRARRVYGLLSLETSPAAPAHHSGSLILTVPGHNQVPELDVSVEAAVISGVEAKRLVATTLARKACAGGNDGSDTPSLDRPLRTSAMCSRNRMTGATPAVRRPGADSADTEEGDGRRYMPASVECFDADTLNGGLVVRTWLPGDRFRPLGQRHAKKLQDYFVDRKVPRDLRKKVPVVCCGSEIIWVVGHQIGDAVKLSRRTARVLRLRCVRHSPHPAV
ncbi:MAG: tRNA lysidine(34) synthetase TilS [Planctomycetota bacterium]|nr:tRNA lysidine(34) synthetase TilS [Planctomycetota bacterium]